MPSNSVVQSESTESGASSPLLTTFLARRKLLAFCGWHFPSKLRAFGEAMRLSEHNGQEIPLLKYLQERHPDWDWNLLSSENEEWWEQDEDLAAIQQDYPILGGGLLRVADILFVDGSVNDPRVKSTGATLATTSSSSTASPFPTIEASQLEIIREEEAHRQEVEMVYDSLMLSKIEYKNRQFAELVDLLFSRQAEQRQRQEEEEKRIREALSEPPQDNEATKRRSSKSSSSSSAVATEKELPQPVVEESHSQGHVTNMEDSVVDMAALELQRQMLSVERSRQRQAWHFERYHPKRVFVAPEEVCNADSYDSDVDQSDVTYAGGYNGKTPQPMGRVLGSPSPDELFPIMSPTNRSLVRVPISPKYNYHHHHHHHHHHPHHHHHHHASNNDDVRSTASCETEDLMREISLLKSSVAHEYQRSMHLRQLEKETFIEKTKSIRRALEGQIQRNNAVENTIGMVQRGDDAVGLFSQNVQHTSVTPICMESSPTPGFAPFTPPTTERSKPSVFGKLSLSKQRDHSKPSFRSDSKKTPTIPRTVSFQELFKVGAMGDSSKFASPLRSAMKDRKSPTPTAATKPSKQATPNVKVIPPAEEPTTPSPEYKRKTKGFEIGAKIPDNLIHMDAQHQERQASSSL